MSEPKSEHRYNYVHDDNGKRIYLHFTGMQWTPHSEYAWKGTLDQLRNIIGGKGYQKIVPCNAVPRAVRVRSKVKPN